MQTYSGRKKDSKKENAHFFKPQVKQILTKSKRKGGFYLMKLLYSDLILTEAAL